MIPYRVLTEYKGTKRRNSKKDRKLVKKQKIKKVEVIFRTSKKLPKNYKIYIKSVFWERRKKQYYKNHEKVCQACNAKKYIDLHHMWYKNYGNELDEHLVALCRECHEEYHSIYGVKTNMVSDTNRFIIEKQEQIEFPRF